MVKGLLRNIVMGGGSRASSTLAAERSVRSNAQSARNPQKEKRNKKEKRLLLRDYLSPRSLRRGTEIGMRTESQCPPRRGRFTTPYPVRPHASDARVHARAHQAGIEPGQTGAPRRSAPPRDRPEGGEGSPVRSETRNREEAR